MEKMEVQVRGERRGIEKEWRKTFVLLPFSFLPTKYSEEASQNSRSMRKPQFNHDL